MKLTTLPSLIGSHILLALPFATAGTLTMTAYELTPEAGLENLTGSDTGSGPTTLSVSTTGTTTPSGDSGAATNTINDGYGTHIQLTLAPGEYVSSQSLNINLGAGGLDDGLKLVMNGVTYLEFDQSNYFDTGAPLWQMFDDQSSGPNDWAQTWALWNDEGNPQLEYDNLADKWVLNATTNTDWNGPDGIQGNTDDILAGTVINTLDYFGGTFTNDSVPTLDFLSGMDIAIYNRNDNGPWHISPFTITASAVVAVPEPSTALLSSLGVIALLLRRRR